MSPNLLAELHRRHRERRELSRNAAAHIESALRDLTLIGPQLGEELRVLVYGAR
jgi:hypothetical protein